MNASVRGIGNVNAPVAVECQIKRLPVVTQNWVWALVRRGRRLPVAAQGEAMQSKHAQPVISGITDKQVGGANPDTMRLTQLTRLITGTAETGNDLKRAGTRIETFEVRPATIEQVDAAIRP